MTWLVPAQLRRKGARRYAHGTDIYRATLQAVERYGGAVEQVSGSFHQLLECDPDLIIGIGSSETNLPGESDGGLLRGQCSAGAFSVCVRPSSRPLGPSYEYDESLVASSTELGPRSAHFRGPQHFSSIETVIAVTKLLHQSQVSSSHKWVWSRMQFPRPLPEQLTSARIELVRAFGTKLTKCELQVNHEPLGCIFFSSKEAS